MPFKSFCYLILIGFTLYSCSSSKHLEKKLLNENPPQNLSTEEIASRLTKIGYAKGGDFEFKVMPISKAYILAEINEISSIRGLTNDEKNSFLRHRNDQYFNNMSCLNLEVTSINNREEVSIDDWDIKVIDSFGAQYPVELNGQKIVTFSEIFGGLYGVDRKWFSQTMGCSRVKINWSEGFQVVLTKLEKSHVNSIQSALHWGASK